MLSSELHSGDLASSQGNIFLVGLMGAGKTSVGRMLARRMRKEFLDADSEVEKSKKKSTRLADWPARQLLSTRRTLG